MANRGIAKSILNFKLQLDDGQYTTGGTLIWRSVSVMIMANIEFIGWGVNSLPMICRYICRTYVTLLKVLCGSDGREVKVRRVMFTSGPVKRKLWEGGKRALTDHQHVAACWGPVEEQRTWWSSFGGPTLPWYHTTPPNTFCSGNLVFNHNPPFHRPVFKSSNTVWGHPIRFPFWCFNHKHLNMLYSDNIRLCVK